MSSIFSTYEINTKSSGHGTLYVETKLHGEDLSICLYVFEVLEAKKIIILDPQSMPLVKTPEDLRLISEALLATARSLETYQRIIESKNQNIIEEKIK